MEKYEEAILDVLIDNFPWLVELLDDPDRPIEDLINFIGGMAYSYGYKAGINSYLAERKKNLYDPRDDTKVKKYEN